MLSSNKPQDPDITEYKIGSGMTAAPRYGFVILQLKLKNQKSGKWLPERVSAVGLLGSASERGGLRA